LQKRFFGAAADDVNARKVRIFCHKARHIAEIGHVFAVCQPQPFHQLDQLGILRFLRQSGGFRPVVAHCGVNGGFDGGGFHRLDGGIRRGVRRKQADGQTRENHSETRHGKVIPRKKR